jgi:hypothetical protein
MKRNREKFRRILVIGFTEKKVIIGLSVLPVEFFIFNFKFNFHRMRITLLAIALLIFSAVQSQSLRQYDHAGNFSVKDRQDSLIPKKWFFSSYRGLSTSVSFFKGGNASIFSAPLGLQLNRRINDNWFAFANVTVAPSYINLNPSYLNGFNKNFSNHNFSQNYFGLYPAASMGVMYINDARTFSISGSVSAEKSLYPVLPYYPDNFSKQNHIVVPHR